MAVSGSARTLQDAELRELRRELERLRSENERLARLVGLVGPRPLPDEAPRSPLFGGLPGAVDHSSSPADKVMFFVISSPDARTSTHFGGRTIARVVPDGCLRSKAASDVDRPTGRIRR